MFLLQQTNNTNAAKNIATKTMDDDVRAQINNNNKSCAQVAIKKVKTSEKKKNKKINIAQKLTY